MGNAIGKGGTPVASSLRRLEELSRRMSGTESQSSTIVSPHTNSGMELSVYKRQAGRPQAS
jgi:hypothetical protein